MNGQYIELLIEEINEVVQQALNFTTKGETKEALDSLNYLTEISEETLKLYKIRIKELNQLVLKIKH